MKLSEAIRLGAMLKPQAKGKIYDTATGGTCALGAALDAIGGITGKYISPDDGEEMVANRWPIASARIANPHSDLNGEWTLVNVVTELNDIRGWTREQIADWVETIELERQPATEQATTDDAVRLSVEQPVAATRA